MLALSLFDLCFLSRQKTVSDKRTSFALIFLFLLFDLIRVKFSLFQGAISLLSDTHVTRARLEWIYWLAILGGFLLLAIGGSRTLIARIILVLIIGRTTTCAHLKIIIYFNKMSVK